MHYSPWNGDNEAATCESVAVKYSLCVCYVTQFVEIASAGLIVHLLSQTSKQLMSLHFGLE